MAEYKYHLPKATQDAIKGGRDVAQCRNMGLLLTRYVPRQVAFGEDKDKKTKWKDDWYRDIVQKFEVGQLVEIKQAYLTRWDAMTKNRAKRFEGTLNSRLIVGLGGKGVLETGITLHHVTGLPYIPGSALKGMTRAYALFSIAAIEGLDVTQDGLLAEFETYLATASDNYEQIKPETYEHAHLFRWAFGNTDQAGALVFYDGVLSGWENGKDGVKYLFDIDIMNSHYQDYYTSDGKKPPSDNQSPNPIKFITVAQGVKFKFALGLRSDVEQLHKKTEPPFTIEEGRQEIYTWMQTALQEFGIGAKTRSGYGMFDIQQEG